MQIDTAKVDKLKEIVAETERYIKGPLAEKLVGEIATAATEAAVFRCVMGYLDEIVRRSGIDIREHFDVSIEHFPVGGWLNVALVPITPIGFEIANDM